jgi:hypothetical protein
MFIRRTQMPKKFTELELQVRIVPRVLRWPGPGGADGMAWGCLHNAVSALRSFVRKLDEECAAIEEASNFKPSAVRERRTALLEQALEELVDFGPIQAAEKAVAACVASSGAKPGYPLQKALNELVEGASATQRAVRARCSNGIWDARELKRRVGA